jgi:hypothetical protein
MGLERTASGSATFQMSSSGAVFRAPDAPPRRSLEARSVGQFAGSIMSCRSACAPSREARKRMIARGPRPRQRQPPRRSDHTERSRLDHHPTSSTVAVPVIHLAMKVRIEREGGQAGEERHVAQMQRAGVSAGTTLSAKGSARFNVLVLIDHASGGRSNGDGPGTQVPSSVRTELTVAQTHEKSRSGYRNRTSVVCAPPP